MKYDEMMKKLIMDHETKELADFLYKLMLENYWSELLIINSQSNYFIQYSFNMSTFNCIDLNIFREIVVCDWV